MLADFGVIVAAVLWVIGGATLWIAVTILIAWAIYQLARLM